MFATLNKESVEDKIILGSKDNIPESSSDHTTPLTTKLSQDRYLWLGFVGSFWNIVFANAPPSIKATGVRFILSVTSPTAQIEGTDVREYSSTWNDRK